MPTPLLRLSSIALVIVTAAIASVSTSCLELDPEHCAHAVERRGHAFCAHRYEDTRWCSRCQPSGNHHGCTDNEDEPPQCLVDGGEPDDPSTATTETTTGPATTDLSEGTDSEGPAECEQPGYDPTCPAEHPICIEQRCEGCERCRDGDQSPPCPPGGDGPCVPCNPSQEPSGCPEGLWCSASYQCEDVCTYHEQCPDLQLCEPVSGTCIGENGARWVDAQRCGAVPTGSQDLPFCTIADALVPNGDTLLIRVVPPADGPHFEPSGLTIASGRHITITGPGQVRPEIEFSSAGVEAVNLDSGALSLRSLVLRGPGGTQLDGIRCEGNTLWLDDVDVTGFADGVILQFCERAIVRRSRIYGNTGVGIVSSTSALHAESSAIVDNSGGGIVSNTGGLSVIYSTILANGTGYNLECNNAKTIRNSIVLSGHAPPNPTHQSSIGEACYGETTDQDNVTEADFEGSIISLETWFDDDYRSGQVHIEPAGTPHFNDKARWSWGDPIYDIDGDPRVNGIDVVTYVGADER